MATLRVKVRVYVDYIEVVGAFLTRKLKYEDIEGIKYVRNSRFKFTDTYLRPKDKRQKDLYLPLIAIPELRKDPLLISVMKQLPVLERSES